MKRLSLSVASMGLSVLFYASPLAADVNQPVAPVNDQGLQDVSSQGARPANTEGWRIKQGSGNPSKQLQSAQDYHPLQQEAPGMDKRANAMGAKYQQPHQARPAGMDEQAMPARNTDGWRIKQGSGNPSKQLQSAQDYHPLQQEAPGMDKRANAMGAKYQQPNQVRPAVMDEQAMPARNTDGWRIKQGSGNPSKQLQSAKDYHPLQQEAPGVDKRMSKLPDQVAVPVQQSNN